MAALSNEVKGFIVQALACFDTPSQVAEAVKNDYGVEVSRQQVESHDPTKVSGKGLAAKWVTLFHDTRKRFREDTAEIPIANRSYRLRMLGRLVEKAESSRNARLALQVLEQAAKECGDMYVNRKQEAQPTTPGDGDSIPAVEYTLSPDEDVPASPVL